MAEKDALVAIQNTLQRLDQQPNLSPEAEFKSVKSKLHRLGSHLDKFDSISDLTKVREIAYNVEDAMDDAIMAAAATKKAAQKRWRKLGNTILFFSKDPTNEINQLVEKQIKNIDSLKPCSIAGDEEEAIAEEQDSAEIPAEKDLFVLSLSGFPAEVEISARRLIQIWMAEGFQDPQGREVKEEEGREQIESLLRRRFITEAKRGTCGDLKTFTIVKDMLEICRKAAMEEHFLHVEMITKDENDESVEVEPSRLAIHNESKSQLLTEDYLRRISDPSKVRSLQIHCAPGTVNNKTPFDYGIQEALMKKFGSLRVLDLECFPLETVPDWIGQ